MFISRVTPNECNLDEDFHCNQTPGGSVKFKIPKRPPCDVERILQQV